MEKATLSKVMVPGIEETLSIIRRMIQKGNISLSHFFIKEGSKIMLSMDMAMKKLININLMGYMKIL